VTSTEFLKRLCEGYVRSYRTFNLRTSAKWTDLTQRELDWFVRLGEMLGFAARLEEQRMDLSWHDVESRKLVLYLERETHADKVLTNTLPKLLQSEESRQAAYLGAVFGWVREQDLPAIKQTIKSRLGNRLLLVIAWVGPTRETAEDLVTFVFSESSVLTRHGKGLRDEDTYWYARFLDQWGPEEQ